MAPLVGAEEERAWKPIGRIGLPEHADDEGHACRLGERPGDDLVGRRVLDRRKAAPSLAVRAVAKIAYVGEQVLPGPADGELPVQLVREQRVLCIAFAILFSGFALLTGHSSPYLRMSRWIFFLFIAVPWSLGIGIAICLDPFGLPLKSQADLTMRKSAWSLASPGSSRPFRFLASQA